MGGQEAEGGLGRIKLQMQGVPDGRWMVMLEQDKKISDLVDKVKTICPDFVEDSNLKVYQDKYLLPLTETISVIRFEEEVNIIPSPKTLSEDPCAKKKVNETGGQNGLVQDTKCPLLSRGEAAESNPSKNSDGIGSLNSSVSDSKQSFSLSDELRILTCLGSHSFRGKHFSFKMKRIPTTDS